jgi:hypothetical protein
VEVNGDTHKYLRNSDLFPTFFIPVSIEKVSPLELLFEKQVIQIPATELTKEECPYQHRESNEVPT